MAKNNDLVMREEEIQTLLQKLDKMAIDVENSGKTAVSSFSGITDAGLMNGVVSSLGNQMSAISKSVNNVKDITTKHSNQMFDLDRGLAELANDIEIPQDFLANNSSEINSYNRTLLGKIDGRSVNEGQAATGFSDLDESSVTAEELENITGQEASEEHYDDSSVIGKSVLSNISGDQTQAQEYDDTNSSEKVNMENVNKNSDTQQQELDTSTNVAAVNLSEVNNNKVESNPTDAYDEIMEQAAFANMAYSQTDNTKEDKDGEENN